MSANSGVIGTYFAPEGTLLSDLPSWTGLLAADIAANISGTAGHTLDMDFAKLTFACLQGWTYSNAQVIMLKIQVLKDGELSQNTGNILQMPINLSEGTLFAPRDLDLRNGVLYSSQFLTEGFTNQGIITIRLDNLWSKNTFRTQIGETGVHSRVFADTASPTGLSVIYSEYMSDRAKIGRVKISSFDADGLPNYAATEDINGVGDPFASTSSWSRIAIIEALTANGMPVILVGKGPQGGVFRTGSILVNIGTAAAPNYGSFVATTAINANTFQIGLPRADSTGRVYFRHFGGSKNRLSRLVYSGPNNDAAALVTAGNWALEPIGVAAALTPALGGTGDVAQFDGWSVAINEDDIVNGEPTLYYADNILNVIFEITRNASSFGDERDWTWVVWAGQSGVAGSADGIGTAATFWQPNGIVYEGGFVYVSDLITKLIRRITVSTVSVETIFGVNGVGGHVPQFDF